MTMSEEFKAAMTPILGDNPNWRESGDGELAWQAWQAATERAARVCEKLGEGLARDEVSAQDYADAIRGRERAACTYIGD